MLRYDAILPGPSTPEDPEEPLGIADAEFILQAGCPGNQQCVSSEAVFRPLTSDTETEHNSRRSHDRKKTDHVQVVR